MIYKGKGSHTAQWQSAFLLSMGTEPIVEYTTEPVMHGQCFARPVICPELNVFHYCALICCQFVMLTVRACCKSTLLYHSIFTNAFVFVI